MSADHGVSPRTPLAVTLVDPTSVAEPWWAEQAAAVAALELTEADAPGAGQSRLLAGPVEAFVSVAGVVDATAERDRLLAALAEADDTIEHASSKLDNEAFTGRAPADVVDKERRKLAEATARATAIRDQLNALD